MMNRTLLIAAVLAAAAAGVVAAQEMSEKELLSIPTSVLVLVDGEQLVIRGDFTVRDGLVLFYLDHGGHPIYASIDEAKVDFDSTAEANERLRTEREREKRYYRLIEERRRRLLEEVQTRPVVIETQAGFAVEEETAAEEREDVSRTLEEFPPYNLETLSYEPESWWRDEAARLFAALDASNDRLAELARQHDSLTLQANRMTSEEEAAPVREELFRVRSEILAEREKARLVGNRLTDLSIAAEELEKPLDWLLPAGSQVIDESDSAIPDAGSEEIPSYDAESLLDVEDAWWASERQRVESMISHAESRLAALRDRYNTVLVERNSAQTEPQRIQLNQQIEALDQSIVAQNDRLARIRGAYDQLVAAARALGKEEALGLMTER
jgi:hypothetical protein